MKKTFVFILASIILLAAVGWFFLARHKTDESLISKAADSPDNSHRLPLGDGKISSEPKMGYIMLCPNLLLGGGTFREGAWIFDDGTWDPSKKLEVTGDVG